MKSQDMNNMVERRFRSFMTDRGYKEMPSVPISSKVDRSVRLVGSAFSRLRSCLQYDDFSAFTIQRAIRTQILSAYYEEEMETEFCSYHVSYGAIVDTQKIIALVTDCIDLITVVLGFSPQDLRIRAASKDNLLLEAIRQCSMESALVIDSECDDRYIHRYSTSLYGRGIKIDYKQNEKFKNIAHVIELFDEEKNGINIGAEMAITNASVLLRQYGYSYAIEIMPIHDLLPCDTFSQRRYADSITVITHLLYEGVRPNSSRMDGRILKKYLKAMNYYAEALGIDEQTRIRHIVEYARIEYNNNKLLNIDLSSIICKY